MMIIYRGKVNVTEDRTITIKLLDNFPIGKATFIITLEADDLAEDNQPLSPKEIETKGEDK